MVATVCTSSDAALTRIPCTQIVQKVFHSFFRHPSSKNEAEKITKLFITYRITFFHDDVPAVRLEKKINKRFTGCQVNLSKANLLKCFLKGRKHFYIVRLFKANFPSFFFKELFLPLSSILFCNMSVIIIKSEMPRNPRQNKASTIFWSTIGTREIVY